MQGPPVALLDLGGRDTRGQGLLAAALSLAAALVVAERHANKVGACCRELTPQALIVSSIVTDNVSMLGSSNRQMWYGVLCVKDPIQNPGMRHQTQQQFNELGGVYIHCGTVQVGMAAPSLLMAQEERLPGAGAVADLWGAPLLLLARSGHATPTPLYHMYKAFIKNTVRDHA
jgi:hypothetical protein